MKYFLYSISQLLVGAVVGAVTLMILTYFNVDPFRVGLATGVVSTIACNAFKEFVPEDVFSKKRSDTDNG